MISRDDTSNDHGDIDGDVVLDHYSDWVCTAVMSK